MSTTAGEPVQDPTGIDVGRVVPWLQERCDWLTPPLVWSRLPGGHSNLTYRVQDAAGHSFVVRRPPLGELLPTAHDMGREYRIIDALWPTPVPVPEPLAFCEDPSVTGAPFYAMGEVQGRSLYSVEQVEELVPLDKRWGLGMHFIEVLAELHSLEPDAVGLGRLGRPDAYVARQLHRWHASWKASQTIRDDRVDLLHEFLSSRVPEQGPGRIVHGDYGLHNCISTAEGRIGAVVDWEISTLGDPLADLAYALNSWEEQGEQTLRVDAPSAAPGFPKRADLVARYGERTGRELSDIDFYVAFNYWKTACIVDGVVARYDAGQKSTEGVDVQALRDRRDGAIDGAARVAAGMGFAH